MWEKSLTKVSDGGAKELGYFDHPPGIFAKVPCKQEIFNVKINLNTSKKSVTECLADFR